jgi:acetylornithine/N-succinyldiaminopimelate aminotransferase
MDEHVMKTYLRADEVFVSGKGAVLQDKEGNEYLDLLAGIAVSALGHGHPGLAQALCDQAGKLVHTSNLFRHPYTEQVAGRLCKLTGMAAVFFTNSGTEAVECALKLCRRAQRNRGLDNRTSFIALEQGFHGRTMGSLSLTWSEKYRKPFGPLLDVTWVPPEDRTALERALRSKNAAALVIEPIQGEGGVRELSPAFLQAARELCTETGTILVHDEIQSGCGRTGSFLAGDQAGVKPDVVTLAKPIAAGLPMGACLANAALADAFQPGEHGSTFAGGPFVLRGALVFLDALERGDLLANVRARGEQLHKGLLALQRDHKIVREVRGRGLIIGLRLHHSAKEVQQALYRGRVITNCTAGDVIRIVPPFVITEAQITEALARIKGVLAKFPQEARA